MTSPLKHLSRFIAKVTRYRQLGNIRKRRRLLLESLEHRNLLAIDSLAAITGTVYLDGVVDTPVESAMVDLYLDDGDGVLERGVGVDRDGDPIDTATTNAAGEYRFEGLQAGTYFVEQRAIENVLPNPAGSVQTVTISTLDAAGQRGITIDSFDETTQLVEFPVNTEASESAVDVQPGEAVGGERDLVVVRTAGDGRVSFTANDLSLGYLELAARLAAVGQGTATWDGDDNDPSTLNPVGLGGIDLTEGGTNSAFRLAVGSDHPSVMLTLTIYTDAGNSSSTTIEVNDTGSATPDTANPALIEFDDLTVLDGAGADLTHVGAIVVKIDGVLDAQVGFDDLGMIGPTFFTADFANFEPLSLGDFVWHDADNNGQQDAGEAGIAGVVVNLYEDTDGSGDLTVGDAPAGTETTDGAGMFLFQSLYPGDYILQVDPMNFDSGAPLADYVSSGDNAGAVDPDDDPSNGDDNGAPLVGQGVVTHAVTLLAGTEPTDDGDGDANSNLSVDFGFTPASDLSVVKSDDPDPVVAGEDLTYTLVVTNNGPADDTGVVVTDTLPSGVTFKSAVVVERPSITPDHTSGEITAQIGDLASGEMVTVTVVVTVDSDVTTLLQNSAEVSGDNYDPNPQNGTSGADTDVETLIDLEITKDDGVEFAYVGEDLVYTLLVTNNGPSDATGITVSDPLPAGVTFVDHTTTQGTASESGGVVTVELGDMAAGATATITITATVDVDAPVELSNTATVEGSGAEPEEILDNNTDTELTEVRPRIDLEIDKTVDLAVVDTGGQLVYTVLVTNNGPSDATGVTITDQLPAGVTFVSATPAGAATESAGVVTIDVGDLASGADAEFTITVDVDTAEPVTLTNSATVAGNEDEVTEANNTDTAETDVNPLIDLEIVKSADLDIVDVGGELTYTLVVSNEGPSDATGVVVVDNLPDGVTYKSAVSTVGTPTESNGVVTIDMGDMASGAEATVTIVVDVDADAVGTLENTTTVSGAEDEVTETNNSANALTDVNPLIDLAIQKTDDPEPVAVNGQLVYTLVVTNNGPSDATGVTVVDELTGPMSYASSTTSQGSIDVSGSTVTANLGDLASGATATVTITVDIASTATGTLSNTAVVAGNEDETNEGNNEATEETTVSPRVDLAIVKADSPDPVVAGEQLTYTLSVENSGPSDATGVEVIDTLPAGVTFVSGSSTVGTVSHDSGVVTVDIGDVAVSGTVVVTIIVDVDPSARGEITNTAEVSSNEEDIDSGNNTDDEPTIVQGNVDLAVTKTDSPDPVTAGDELTYTLTVTNDGPSDATLVELTDTLPSEVAYVSSSVSQGSVSHSAGVVTAALGDLDVGETATVTIVVTVDSETFGTIDNEAEVTAAESEVNTTDNSTIEPTVVDELLSSLAGFVYIDLDNDGQMDEGEPPLAGVSIQLVGTGPEGETIERQAVTDENGAYLFEELRRGTYALTEIQPDRYLDGIDTRGTVPAVTDDDAFTEIELPPGVDAVDYLFGERAPGFSKRRFLSSRQS